MGTQGVGTFLINSKFASGSLVFYEKAVGRTATGDVFTVGTTAVKVGNTSQDVDFQFYGTGSISAIIDCGAATFTLVGIATSTNGAVTITNATATSSTTTGALIVTGGIATAADITVGDDIFLAATSVINFGAGDVTITGGAGTLAFAGASSGVSFDGLTTVTVASLNATTGRISKFDGTVLTPNFGDGYGAVEVNLNIGTGAVAGHVAAMSSWINLAADTTFTSLGYCVSPLDVGIYAPSGTLTNGKFIMGLKMSCVIDNGANPGELYLFNTNIFSNALTAMFDINALVDIAATSGAASAGAYKFPILKERSTGTTWYINMYTS